MLLLPILLSVGSTLASAHVRSHDAAPPYSDSSDDSLPPTETCAEPELVQARSPGTSFRIPSQLESQPVFETDASQTQSEELLAPATERLVDSTPNIASSTDIRNERNHHAPKMTMETKTVLVTGGAGYIGSHTVLEMVQVGMKAVVLDNLDNSSEESLRRVADLTGKPELIVFRNVDLLDYEATEEVFKEFKFDACVHFAGLKAVGESVQMPVRYYHNNLTGTLHLLELLTKYGCKNFVFSSSATVYGLVKEMPVTESVEIGATNPYGRTKLFIEEFLRDLHKSDEEWNVLILRYFNPVGAHKSGRIGEDPAGIPNNLMPYIAQVAVGRRPHLTVFGDDYPTPDGTGMRDYIHVIDLAKGHLAALKKLDDKPGCVPVNLGTGTAYSVLEMLKGMSKACGRELEYKVAPRREGDVSELYADPAFAREFLGWEAKLGLEDMCADSWRWQSENPNGFRDAQ